MKRTLPVLLAAVLLLPLSLLGAAGKFGAPLGDSLPGRLGLEIRATLAGGRAILDRIDAVSGDVFRHRPTLTTMDWIRILGRALFRSDAA